MLKVNERPYFDVGGVYFILLANGDMIITRVTNVTQSGEVYIINPHKLQSNNNMCQMDSFLKGQKLKLGDYCLAQKVEDDNFISVYEQYIESY